MNKIKATLTNGQPVVINADAVAYVCQNGTKQETDIGLIGGESLLVTEAPPWIIKQLPSAPANPEIKRTGSGGTTV